VVHEEAIASQSPALNTLMRGEMSESKNGVAFWGEVDEQTFVRFVQFAYTGDYSVQTMVVSYAAHESHRQKEAQNMVKEPIPEDNGWDFSIPSKYKKSKSKGVLFDNGEGSHSLRPAIFHKSRTYHLLQPRSKFAGTCDAEVVAGSEENITEPLLSHNSLYVFAEKWGIDSLKALTLFKLHQTLCIFPLDESNAPNIVELARSGYSGTPDLESGIDELRALIGQYIAANVEVMLRNTAFTELVEEGGAFARDLIKFMVPRIG
jgi:hypothetical protein